MRSDDETIDWIFEASRWWLSCFGNVERCLVPTPEDIPLDGRVKGHPLASALLGIATLHTGLTRWPFMMTSEQTPRVADLLEGMSHPATSPVTPAAGPAELIQPGGPLPIPYHVRQLEDPEDLLATIARGMSHYMMSAAPTPFPGEAEDREYFVDLGGVFLGFGVFLANSAFKFEQTTEGMMVGWSFARRGALSELDISYALALAATLSDTPDKKIVRCLRGNPRSFFKTARKHIRKKRKAELETLYDTPSLSEGPYR